MHPEFMASASGVRIADGVSVAMIGHVAKDMSELASAAVDQVEKTIAVMSETKRRIIEDRLLSVPPAATLQEIGSDAGVTRERIRQIQSRIEDRIRDALGDRVRIMALEVKEGLACPVQQEEVDRRIEALLPAGQSFAARIVRKALIDEMGLIPDDGIYLDEQAARELMSIRAGIRGAADDTGLVNERLVMAALPTEEWRRALPWVRARINLHEMQPGILGLRDSIKARVKAALLKIGRPATKKEIGTLCGITEKQAGAQLSCLPSVARADKDRWGLKNWIDDEYDGIVEEMIKLIEEGGGTTQRKRLMKELPRKFNVRPNSVEAYMRSPKFERRNGLVSLAKASSLKLKNLDEVIHGRDAGGFPYWTFLVEARLFRGYSVACVPPEFAKALGCEPNQPEHIRIANLPRCRELSISWRLESTNGASIGYVAEPLRKLGLKAGQRARVTIKGPRQVDLDAHDGGVRTSKQRRNHPRAAWMRALKRRSEAGLWTSGARNHDARQLGCDGRLN